MSDFISNIKDSASSAKEKYLGPSYDYVKNIKLPSEMGMGPKGDLRTLGKDIEGLIGYVQLLVSGGGVASVPKGPMGNKFFLQTGAKCMTGEEQHDRFIYINNVPYGNIPFISAGMGVNFTAFRGLVPGTIEQLNNFNPLTLLSAFTSGPSPECTPLTMETIDVNNNKNRQTEYVTLTDIRNMDPCWFLDKINPQTGVKCRETFSNINNNSLQWTPVIPQDTYSQIYFASLGALGIYISYKAMQRMNLIPK
jgi:hypothetical protein